MSLALPSTNALENIASVEGVADSYQAIAEALHSSLRLMSDQVNVSTEKAYGLITEEYGLRTRLGILRADAKNRTVDGVEITHASLVNLLSQTAEVIRNSRSLDELAYIVNSVTVLCISFSPGKKKSVNFLVSQLESDLEMMRNFN
jgi:hypothetical protein